MIVDVVDAIERKITDPALVDAIGARGVELLRKRIGKGSFAPNASVTQEVKRGNRPLRDGFRGGTYKGPQLIDSVTYKPGNGSVIFGTVHPAAALLHRGGTLTPKSTRFLAMPVSSWTRDCMRTYGGTSATARSTIEGMKAAGWVVWVLWHQGKGFVMARSEKATKPRALFALKSKVDIPARPFFFFDATDLRMLRLTAQERIMK